MALDQEDVERQTAESPGKAPMTWRQRASHFWRTSYLVEYGGFRKHIDKKWRAFLDDNLKGAEPVAKYPEGQARFTAVAQGSTEMGIFRRFDWLSTYCLVDAQKDLTKFEADLRKLCKEQEQRGPDLYQAYHNSLVRSIRESLVSYSDLAEAKYKLLQYPEPEAASYTSLLTAVHGNPDAFRGVDPSWLFKEDDLMTLDPRPPKTHLAKRLEAVLDLLPEFLFSRLHMTNKFERQLYPENVKSISYDRLMALTLVVSTILALVFIHVPVGMLYFYVDWTKWEKFGAIIGWSVGFLGYLWLATHASSYEALGAAASYCALLVVFLGLS